MKLYTEDYFRQRVVAIEATPAFLGGLSELEDHGERCLVRETSFERLLEVESAYIHHKTVREALQAIAKIEH